MSNTFQQGLSGSTGVSGFGTKLNEMNQFGTPMFPYGGALPYTNTYMTGSPLIQFQGPSHENGGINFNNRAELEKNETIDTENK